MTTTRTYDDIHADIAEAAHALAVDTAGPDRGPVRAERCERLATLWREVSNMSWHDRAVPGVAALAATLLADRYANDAREYRAGHSWLT